LGESERWKGTSGRRIGSGLGTRTQENDHLVQRVQRAGGMIRSKKFLKKVGGGGGAGGGGVGGEFPNQVKMVPLESQLQPWQALAPSDGGGFLKQRQWKEVQVGRAL